MSFTLCKTSLLSDIALLQIEASRKDARSQVVVNVAEMVYATPGVLPLLAVR